jgi:hypothetical protein
VSSLLQVERRVLSRPVEVWWSGFRATTAQLQQAGWELAAEESIVDRRIRLLMRHQDLKLYAITHHEEWNYFSDSRQQAPLVFRVIGASSQRIEFRVVETLMPNFQRIDAMPQFTEQKIVTTEDLRVFAVPLVRTEEIIVDPERVGEILERIRQAQLPEQQAIRARNKLRASREGETVDALMQPRQQFHAQVLSIAA